MGGEEKNETWELINFSLIKPESHGGPFHAFIYPVTHTQKPNNKLYCHIDHLQITTQVMIITAAPLKITNLKYFINDGMPLTFVSLKFKQIT